jgi:hypothetical protein
MQQACEMMEQIRSDESLQVLVYIVLPLTIAFVVGLVLWIWYKPRSEVYFPNFSVRLLQIERGWPMIVYQDKQVLVEFPAYERLGQGLCIAIPDDKSDEVAREIARNMALALPKMGFKRYRILKGPYAEVILSSDSGK